MSTYPVRWSGVCERCGLSIPEDRDTREEAEADVQGCPCQSAEASSAEGSTSPLTDRARRLLAVIRAGGEAGQAVYSAAFDALGELERAALVTVEWGGNSPYVSPYVLAYPTERTGS